MWLCAAGGPVPRRTLVPVAHGPGAPRVAQSWAPETTEATNGRGLNRLTIGEVCENELGVRYRDRRTSCT